MIRAKQTLGYATLLACTVLSATSAWADTPVLAPWMAIGQVETKDARREADDLVRRARAAMKDGKLELAERFIVRAEKLNVSHGGVFGRFADTPEKVRKDLDRLKQNADRSGSRRLPGLFARKDSSDQPAQEDPFAGEPAGEPGSAPPRRLPTEAARSATPLDAQVVNNPYAARPAYPTTGQPSMVGAPGRPQLQDIAVASPEVKRDHALRLVAQSQAALGRGDIPLAESLAQQAHSLGVPDGAFAGGDTPWMILMRVNKERQRRGDTAPAGTADADGNPRQARVQPALYDPEQDNTYVRSASAEEPLRAPVEMLVQQRFAPAGQEPGQANSEPFALPPQESGESILSPPPATFLAPTDEGAASAPLDPVDTSGAAPTELLRMGEDALRKGNLDEARRLFRQAWAYEQDLDPATRQRLQDHLQLMRADESPNASVSSDTEQQRAQLEARKLLSEIGREQTAAARLLRTEPKAAWERLKGLRARVADADIDENARKPLVARLDRAIAETENFIEQNRSKIELDERNRDVLTAIDRERQMRVDIDNKLARMVDSFNTLMDEQRYPEAYVLAKQARDLAPRNAIVENMIWKSRFAERLMVEMSLQDRSQQGLLGQLESATESGIPYDDRNPIQFPKEWEAMTKRRIGMLSDGGNRYSETELAIERALRKKVQVQFEERPLAEVMNTLARMAGVNMFLDPQGLAAEGVTSDLPVSINLTQEVSLRSALNLILHPFHLSYVIQDEVLRITSEQARADVVYPRVYYVADLVVPIPNFLPGYNNGLAGALQQAHAALGYGYPGGMLNQAPLVVAANQQQSAPNASVLAQMDATGMLGNVAQTAQPLALGPGGVSGGSQPDFDTLIELITSTVAPESWDEVGGPGTLAQYDGNLSLVVSNTQEVHEQIVGLLEQLRRLQDLQVTIEVRFITLRDDFFERIGVDFDFNIRDGSGLTPQDILDARADGTDENLDITIGLDPQGNPTANLDLTFNQNTFGSAVPIFGGFDQSAASTFGFAILSDIEAFFVMEAIQGDRRTNVMQSPKVTLFNGQFATINDTSSRPFVTSVIPVVGDFAVAHQPVILVLAEGTTLNVQAVVSNDRRFVRLTLIPSFTQIGDVETFTFNGRRSSSTGSATAVDPDDNVSSTDEQETEIIEGTTVQLPTFNQTSVTTTVSVPDGGTILLGGIKALREGRNERGMPVLSKIPYVNRLFKNVGLGRETSSLMMMVTPRIIIQEEEEERLLGTPVP